MSDRMAIRSTADAAAVFARVDSIAPMDSTVPFGISFKLNNNNRIKAHTTRSDVHQIVEAV